MRGGGALATRPRAAALGPGAGRRGLASRRLDGGPRQAPPRKSARGPGPLPQDRGRKGVSRARHWRGFQCFRQRFRQRPARLKKQGFAEPWESRAFRELHDDQEAGNQVNLLGRAERHDQPVPRNLVSASWREFRTMPVLIHDELRRLVGGERGDHCVDRHVRREAASANSATLLALKGLAGHRFRFILSGAVAKEAGLRMEKAAGVASFPNSSAR